MLIVKVDFAAPVGYESPVKDVMRPATPDGPEDVRIHLLYDSIIQ